MISPGTILESKNLRLRRVSLEDISLVYSASRFEGFCEGMRWDPPDSEDDLIAHYESNIQAWENGSGYTFTIERVEDSTAVGRIVIRRKEEGLWDIGYWTHPAHQGRGHMTEAVGIVLEFGFAQLAASEIQAAHAIWNTASRRVLEKAGFRFLRYEPRGFEKHGSWVEENFLVITREDWNARIVPAVPSK